VAERNFRSPEPDSKTLAKHRQIMIEILERLSEPDRQAVLSFYIDRKTETAIEAECGVPIDHLRSLRRSMRAEFSRRLARC